MFSMLISYVAHRLHWQDDSFSQAGICLHNHGNLQMYGESFSLTQSIGRVCVACYRKRPMLHQRQTQDLPRILPTSMKSSTIHSQQYHYIWDNYDQSVSQLCCGVGNIQGKSWVCLWWYFSDIIIRTKAPWQILVILPSFKNCLLPLSQCWMSAWRNNWISQYSQETARMPLPEVRSRCCPVGTVPLKSNITYDK